MTLPRPAYPAVLLLAMTVLARGGEPPEHKDPDKGGEVEVHLSNGSVVRLHLVQDHIDVMTRFGKLTVPLSEVQRIEFGVHLPPDIEKRVEGAIRRLSSDQFPDRDDAARELLALGAHSYPALLRAVKSGDKEVALRSEKILHALRAKLPEKDLRSKEEDLVATPGFNVVGRIITPSFKVESEYFGSVGLQLSQLRHLRSIKNPGEAIYSVDATQYGSVHGQWLDTGFQTDPSSTLLIVASGTIDIYPLTPGQYLSTPKGYSQNLLAPGARVQANAANLRNFSGALFGRIGEGGDVFYIGERYEGCPGRDGRLYLHIVPSPWNNASSGAYQVKVSARN